MSIDSQVVTQKKQDLVDDDKLQKLSAWLVDKLEYCDKHKKNNYSEDWEIYDRMVKGAYANQYDTDDANENWRSQLYYNIAEQKRRSAISQLDDALGNGGKFPFALSETPVSETDDSVNEMLRSIGVDVEKSMTNMEKSMDDNLLESKSYIELRKTVDDCSKYGVGCFKSPHLYMDKARRININALSAMPALQNENGQMTPEGEAMRDEWLKSEVLPNMNISEIERIGFKRVKPADIFPDPACEGDSQKGFGIFERNHYSSTTLRKMADEMIDMGDGNQVPKYDADMILTILMKHHDGEFNQEKDSQYQSTKTFRHNLDDDSSTIRGIPVYTFYGDIKRIDIQGTINAPSQITQNEEGSIEDYDTVSVIVDFTRDGEIIRVIENPHPSGLRPIHLWQWETVDGDWVGKGICEKLRDLQSEFNRFLRYWVDNKLLSSSVILGVITSKLDRSENEDMKMYPGKTFFMREGESIHEMIQQFNVQDVSGAFLEGLTKLMELIDHESGVPRIIEGQNGANAKTAFETQQQEAHALKQLGTVIKNLDQSIILGVEMIYQYMLVYHDQSKIVIGDFKIQATGFSTFENKRIKMMELDRLIELAMASPEFYAHFNIRKIIEDKVSLLGVSSDKYLKTVEEVEIAMQQQQQQAMQQEQMAMQAAMQEKMGEAEAKIAVEQAKAEVKGQLEMMKLQVEAQENEKDRDHDIKRDIIKHESELEKGAMK